MGCPQGFSLDCGRLSVDNVSPTGFHAKWSCPCSGWSSVEYYTFKLIAADGEHPREDIVRCPGKYTLHLAKSH